MEICSHAPEGPVCNADPKHCKAVLRVFIAGAVLLVIVIGSSCEGFFVDPTLTSIAVTPPTPSVVQNATLQMTATGSYDDGTINNITGKVTWSSSDTAKATVSSAGVVKGVSPGSATISATSANISGSTTVGVTVASLVSIQISPASVSAITGQTISFRATGTFAEGGTEDVTDAVVWSDSNGGVTISNSPPTNGQAQIVGPFASLPVRITVTATSGDVSASATLTVTQ